MTEKVDVRVLRERLGRNGRLLSREKLAQRLDCSFQSVTNWERGRNLPSPLARVRLAQLERETRQ